MKNEKGFYDMHHPMSKTQPARASDGSQGDDSGYKKTSPNTFGDAHDFNHKAKVTSNDGSDYHDTGRKDSGLYGNFAEKDASMAYLKKRGQQGQEVRHFSGTHEQGKITTGAGNTAYNSNPVYETYTPATSHNSVPDQAVMRPTVEKTENPPLVKQEKETKRLKS